jgi:hypothetical protein
MTNTIITFLMSFIFLFGCNSNREPNYIDMSNEIVDNYLIDMKSYHGLRCFGRGGGFMEKVNVISISFTLQGQRNQMELREIIVSITEDLLKRYNNNQEIRPYLKNYPFTAENLRIAIYLVDDKGAHIHNKGSLRDLFSGVFQSYGEVSYAVENDLKPYPQDVFEETYEEALMIVKNKKSS